MFSFYPEAPVILIDASYYIFHRYFATLRWYSFQKTATEPEGVKPEGGMCECEDFMKAYFKHLEADMGKFRKKLGTKKSTIFFLRDCPQRLIWRNALYESYKSGRVVSAKMDVRIFQKTYAWIDETYPNSMISQECLEADDLAYLVKKALREAAPDIRLVFLTNDNDYLQLCDENSRCFNAGLKNIQERCKYGGGAATEKRAKILLGDRSDAIGTCMTPELKKAATLESLLTLAEPELIDVLQRTSLKAYEQYCLNRALIDMAFIPEEHQARFALTHAFAPS